MIYEYAIEPEMVAAWGGRHIHRIYYREFGLESGRLVSRYPKKWARKVWESFTGSNDMDQKRLEELLVRLQETMIKRKDIVWDDAETWLENSLQEHARYPFHKILSRVNPENLPEILDEEALASSPCPGWDNPHGAVINRKAPDMAAAVEGMLSSCRWVKFIDPYFVRCKRGHKISMSAFFNILSAERSVGPLEKIEMHTCGNGATLDHLKDFYERIIPTGMQVTIFQWQERPGGQRLHNRYILTDLGGVSFNHGLDTGAGGETDDVNLLTLDQYRIRCEQYNAAGTTFELTESPVTITGTRRI